jgi:hypothetical protein
MATWQDNVSRELKMKKAFQSILLQVLLFKELGSSVPLTYLRDPLQDLFQFDPLLPFVMK